MIIIEKLKEKELEIQNQEAETPKKLYERFNNEFGFTLDAAARDGYAKCKTYFTKLQNGLIMPWDGHRVFVHPPANGQLRQWIAKGFKEVFLHRKTPLAVLFVPACTSSQAWS